MGVRKMTPAMAKALLAKRNAQDPLLHMKLIPTFLECAKEKARFVCITSANQVGKTAFLCWTASALLRGKHPHLPYFGSTKGLLIVPSRAQAAEIYGTRLVKRSELAGPLADHPFIPKHEIKRIDWAVSPLGRYPGKITMRDGATLVVVLSGDPNSWKRMQGLTFDWVIRDEVAGTENMGNELIPRLVASHSRMLGGHQPWGGRVWWFATGTMFNQEWLDYRTRCSSNVEDHTIYHPDPSEANDYVSMIAREAMKTTMSAAAYKIRGAGTSDAGDLVQIFGQQWDDKRHLLARDHVIAPTDCINIGWDPGVDHPTGIVISANSMDNPRQVKIIKCFMHANESLDYDIECIHSFLLGRKLATFVYDGRAKERHKHARALIHELMDKLERRGYRPLGGYLMSDKRHTVGINTMREYLDPRPFDKTANPLLVLNPSAESGCPMLRSQLIGYHGKESTAFTGPGGVVKKDDDLCFDAETPVLMANGEERSIFDIVAEDYVMTPVGPRMVTWAGMTSESAAVEKYWFKNGKEITCTPNHRFWCEGEWLEVGALIGSDALTTHDEKKTSIASKDVIGNRPVYDIEVEGAHCFYASGILVHNCDASRYLIRSCPVWTGAYQTGLPTHAVSSPMESDPVRAQIPKQDTPEAARARLSALSASRTKQSVIGAYSWQSRQAAHLRGR